MNVVKGTLLEVVAVGVISVAVALTANGMRAKGLTLNKNYFEMRTTAPPVEATSAPAVDTAMEAGSVPATSDQPTTPETEPTGERLVHGFRVVSFVDVMTIYDDPNTAAGVNIFVDARNDDSFEEGHIPGAIQADHYRIEDYIDNVMLYTDAAEKIIVYCNGGDCEDSGLVCNDLMDAGVAWDKLYLYEGGWQEWKTNDMPIATGREGGE